MKIRMEIDDKLENEEIVIRCRELNDEVAALQRQIAKSVNTSMHLHVEKGEREYFLPLEEILFLETAGSVVAVHTREDIYSTRQRLYELEELLPGSFLRISKSTIVNTGRIRSVRKNLAGASEVEFAGTTKKTFASRSYFKLLMEKMEEKRLRYECK